MKTFIQLDPVLHFQPKQLQVNVTLMEANGLRGADFSEGTQTFYSQT